MNKKIKTLLTIIISILSTQALSAPPIFVSSYQDAQKISKDLRMEVMTIVSADWCVYCVELDKQISDNLEIFENIIILKLDFDKNPEFVKKNKIKKLPTILYDGNKYVGKYDILDLKKILRRH